MCRQKFFMPPTTKFSLTVPWHAACYCEEFSVLAVYQQPYLYLTSTLWSLVASYKMVRWYQIDLSPPKGVLLHLLILYFRCPVVVVVILIFRITTTTFRQIKTSVLLIYSNPHELKCKYVVFVYMNPKPELVITFKPGTTPTLHLWWLETKHCCQLWFLSRSEPNSLDPSKSGSLLRHILWAAIVLLTLF